MTLTPGYFRDLLQQRHGTEEIGRLLSIASDDFRVKKIYPHLNNLRTVLATTQLVFDSITAPHFGELTSGLELNGSELESMRELACEAQRTNDLDLIRNNASWACKHIADVVREGLAVYESAQDQTQLLFFKESCENVSQEVLLLVEDYQSERSYAYECDFSVNCEEDEEGIGEMERNFPRMEREQRPVVGERKTLAKKQQSWLNIQSVSKRDKYWSYLELTRIPDKPVFYFWCRFPLPFQETVFPLAIEELRLRLQRSNGHQTKVY